MSIEVSCSCGARFMAIHDLAGKTVRCPTCGGPLHVPAPSALEPLDLARDPLADLGAEDPLALPVASYKPPKAAHKRATSKNARQALLVGGVAGAGILGLALAVVLIAWLLMSLGPRKYASPEAVFAASHEAVKAKDWKTAFETLTPEAQDKTIAGLAITLVLAGQFDKDFQAVAQKHGIASSAADFSAGGDPQQRLAKMEAEMRGGPNTAVGQIKNKGDFYRDVMTCMSQKSDEMMKKMNLSASQKKSLPPARLINLVVDGNTARGEGSMTVGGRTFNTPVQFKKVDGSWRIDLDFGAFNAPAQSVNPLIQ